MAPALASGAMVYLHPLAFLLGYEGVALLRAMHGEHDRTFVEERFSEIKTLCDAVEHAEGAEVQPVSAVDGYGVWSHTYDQPGNGLFGIEEPVVHRIIGGLEQTRRVLDAACGTGRHAAWLAGQGYEVIGVDSSPDMLARARARVPAADFRRGDLGRLPVADAEVDLVVCSLALTHVADLRPVTEEFARVLRPGGHAVIADTHHEKNLLLGAGPKVRLPDGGTGALPLYRHLASDYIGAALSAGLQVRGCEEPLFSVTAQGPMETEPVETWPWNLLGAAPEAVRAAFHDLPIMVIWTFQKVGAG